MVTAVETPVGHLHQSSLLQVNSTHLVIYEDLLSVSPPPAAAFLPLGVWLQPHPPEVSSPFYFVPHGEAAILFTATTFTSYSQICTV